MGHGLGENMSVELYQKGEQRDINGLMCNTLLVAPELFDIKLLPSGWFLTPEKAYEEVKEQAEEIKAEPKTEEKPEETKVLRGNAKIRHDAKQAGIEDWEKARIATLKDKLKA